MMKKLIILCAIALIGVTLTAWGVKEKKEVKRTKAETELRDNIAKEVELKTIIDYMKNEVKVHTFVMSTPEITKMMERGKEIVDSFNSSGYITSVSMNPVVCAWCVCRSPGCGYQIMCGCGWGCGGSCNLGAQECPWCHHLSFSIGYTSCAACNPLM
jgi:hypothetical protein